MTNQSHETGAVQSSVDSRTTLRRRGFMVTVGAAIVALAWASTRRPALAAVNATTNGPVTIVPFTDAGVRQTPMTVPKVVKTEAEWHQLLDATQFAVARKEGTERPFTGATWNLHDKGIYRCVCCGTPVYDSETKFESGTGWPSFWQPIAKENIVETEDRTFMMVRTAVSCKRCDAHLGHVFDDGPKPTGLRYCMNSAAMKFVKRA
jgi:peptide-methionine (R)-S-oxide reductase